MALEKECQLEMELRYLLEEERKEEKDSLTKSQRFALAACYLNY